MMRQGIYAIPFYMHVSAYRSSRSHSYTIIFLLLSITALFREPKAREDYPT
jgi:hypothetical protein